MSLGRWRLRPSLGVKFVVFSALAFLVLGVVGARSIRDGVTRQQLESATDAADLIARVGIEPLFQPSAFSEGLTTAKIDQLDERLSNGRLTDQVVRVKVWNEDGTVIYSDDHSIIGKSFAKPHDLEEALGGELVSEVSDLDEAEEASERGFKELLEVYVPIRLEAGARPIGAFELYLPYHPIQESIAGDVQSLLRQLLAGLLLLYLVLFRMVNKASRRLRDQANELRDRADENEFLALHDTLTQLPNRRLFHDRAQQAILTARRDGSEVALMMFDLDRFKEVNDTLGHHNGDLLLQVIAGRLKETLREYDSIARLGGDEFAILMPDAGSRSDIDEVASRVKGMFAEPFKVQDLLLDVSASFGIAIFPDHAANADELLQRADVAMYQAKGSDERIAIYNPLHDNNSPARLALVGELRHAIETDALELHYQPKLALDTGMAVGVEALVRWRHPEQGLLPPDVFIELAEQTGLIKPLTFWVLDAALRQMDEWRSSGLDISVAVNLSVRNLLDIKLPDDVAMLLAKWNADPMRVTLEITEGGMMADPSRTIEVLNRLSSLGVVLSIDDFGTGHSSLAYLKQLPVREVKIDRSFVMDMATERSGEVIVRSTIDLGHNLAMSVIAEGVEDAQTFEELRNLGCDLAQGFFLSRPLPTEEVTAWLRAQRASIGDSLAAPLPGI